VPTLVLLQDKMEEEHRIKVDAVERLAVVEVTDMYMYMSMYVYVCIYIYII
jgi:hypothetical protein